LTNSCTAGTSGGSRCINPSHYRNITFTFTFTLFFNLCVRPMRPVGCSLASPYELARIKGVSQRSPQYLSSLIPLKLFSDGADTTSFGRLFHKVTTRKEKNVNEPRMRTTVSLHQLVVMTSQGSLRCSRQKFSGS